MNGVSTCALVDTGSQLNAVSEQWFKDNKKELGDLETLKLSNTVIKGAAGNKSKRITQQILLTVQIEGLKVDSVFVVVPELIKDCILGIGLLEENGCVIDLNKKRLIIQGEQNHEETTAEIILMELSYTDEDIEESSGRERD